MDKHFEIIERFIFETGQEKGSVSGDMALVSLNAIRNEFENLDVASPLEHAHPLFSINTYDQDGDLTDEGIFLHYGKVSIKVASTLAGFQEYIKSLQSMIVEITENYNRI